jgi:hypothetical protein
MGGKHLPLTLGLRRGQAPNPLPARPDERSRKHLPLTPTLSPQAGRGRLVAIRLGRWRQRRASVG